MANHFKCLSKCPSSLLEFSFSSSSVWGTSLALLRTLSGRNTEQVQREVGKASRPGLLCRVPPLFLVAGRGRGQTTSSDPTTPPLGATTPGFFRPGCPPLHTHAHATLPPSTQGSFSPTHQQCVFSLFHSTCDRNGVGGGRVVLARGRAPLSRAKN